MTTHVFIVNSRTFKLHLEYLFAGTGAGENFIDFNNCSGGVFPRGTGETNLVSMIADASRIRKGDKIIFYLQGYGYGGKGYEGKFFGIFKAVEDWSFLDNNDSEQYLKNELGKSLTFRTLIEPYEVYPEGVTEWKALDQIKQPSNRVLWSNEMQWSLIYRKLKGNRGNTMITIAESKGLCDMIRQENKNKNSTQMVINEQKLSFASDKQTIICLEESACAYEGRKEEINVLPRLIKRYNGWKAFEAHLQAYIIKNIGMKHNISLDNSLIENRQGIEWLGNEISCGVGMQSIDIMLSVKHANKKIVLPIELKACSVYPSIVD